MSYDESDYKPFTLKAKLLQGVVFDTRFGIGLDALLASSIRKREKSIKHLSGRELDGGLSLGEVEVVDLPLGKCIINEDLWHWQSTMGKVLAEHPDEEVSFFIQHADIHAFEQAASFDAYPNVISEQKGRYRARRTPIVKTLGEYVIWNGYGSLKGIQELVERIPSIGQRRTSGEGTILSWEIEEAHVDNVNMHTHSLNGETLDRPCSTQCLDVIESETGIPLSYDMQRVGYRPPYWHFGNMETMPAPPFNPKMR